MFLFFLPQEPAPEIELTIVPDAWPRAPRNVGQKFGMNTRDTIPTEELQGEDDSADAEEIGRGNVPRFRVVGVRIANRQTTLLDGRLSSPQVPGLPKEVHLRPGESGRFFFVVPDRKGLEKIRFELKNGKANRIAEGEAALDPKARLGARSEASLIVAELQAERAARAKYEFVSRIVEVRDEGGRGLKGAQLTFVHPRTGMIVDGTAGDDGTWKGSLLAGEWQVFARSVVVPETPTGGSTVSAGNPLLYYLAGTLTQGRLRLAPDQRALLSPPGDRLAIVPSDFAEMLRYETIHERVGSLFLLRTEPTAKGQPVILQSTSGLLFDVQSFSVKRFMTVSKIAMKGEVDLDRAKASVLSFDPAKVPGGAERFDVALSFPTVPREVYRFSVVGATEIAVPQGPVRVELTVRWKDGASLRFAPYLVSAPGDLTPTAFRVTPYFQATRGLMVWVAIEDAQGKIVTRLDGIAGTLAASAQGRKLFESDVKNLTFHFPTEFDKINLPNIAYAVTVGIGGAPVTYTGKARPRKLFADPPSNVDVPDNLEERARSMMPTIRKTLAGGQRFLAVPKFDLRVSFEIRLPPEVGGLGGGGVMMLDLGEILEYAHETDRLPGAYTHELGHNFGYGHDPYMTMASCGVDEGLYGTPGYLLLNGRAPSRLFTYLDRESDAAEWQPSGDLFATLRMLYGPEIHNRMFGLKRKLSARLDRAGLSIPEQMAAYYSAATGENPAWMFRAFGWPVFDYRVRLAQAMIQEQNLASQGKLPAKIDGTYINAWWVRGPIPMGNAAATMPWKIHKWDGRFLLLATEENFLQNVGYRFYLTVQSLEDQMAFLSIASDVQVAFYLNGKRVSRVAAAPQFSQPMHEGYTMERANATVVPIALQQGENVLEMVVVKTAGSKGMWIELANAAGKPIQDIGMQLQKGPDELENADRVAHPIQPPVFNPSFESGMDSWIAGARDGDGELAVVVDDKIARDGKRSLRLEAKGALSGSVIQRLVLDENAQYQFTGWMHTEGFHEKVDKAYIGLFTGNPNEEMVVQTDVIEKNLAGWQKVTFRYKSDRRCLYLGCILKSGPGARVWFDDVRLVRIR